MEHTHTSQAFPFAHLRRAAPMAKLPPRGWARDTPSRR